eukprot:TRINITY_DN1221_c0_g2_i1.p1 TRINITY_DN1221_c0_g2~~TRINITY_DN1221_c0_g2_i1.p1  ORF type:complete len:133 (+),score=66.94 TRINITY_DN1221_c0_g2_i1:373-771(+)
MKDMSAGSEYLKHKSTNVDGLPDEVTKMKFDFFKAFQENDFDLTDERKVFDWSSKQTYIALGNMMSAAAEIGVDSCPIEGFNREKTEDLLEKEGVLDKEHFGISVMAAFGYRKANSPHPQTRHSMDDVVEWV